MDTLMTRLSIPIYLPSGVKNTEDWLTLLRADSLAKIYLPQGAELDLMAIAAGSGGKCLDAFGKWDQSTSSLRTLQESLLEDRPEPWSESWPVSGTMRNGTCYRLPPLVPRTSVGGGGVWPTPTGSQARSEGMINQMRDLVDAGEMTVEQAELMIGGSLTPDRMSDWQPRFPTPQTTDAPDGGGPPNKNANTTQWNGANSLGQMAKQGLWPTPKGSADHYGQPRENDGGDLQAAAITFPTPKTPTGGGQMERTTPGGGIRKLEDKVSQLEGHNTGQLNPEFVEFLMGVPQGWVSLEPLPPEHWQRWLTEDHWAAGEWEGVPRVATGVKDRVNQLKMLGNGIVPDCPAAFLELLAK